MYLLSKILHLLSLYCDYWIPTPTAVKKQNDNQLYLTWICLMLAKCIWQLDYICICVCQPILSYRFTHDIIYKPTKSSKMLIIEYFYFFSFPSTVTWNTPRSKSSTFYPKKWNRFVGQQPRVYRLFLMPYYPSGVKVYYSWNKKKERETKRFMACVHATQHKIITCSIPIASEHQWYLCR